MPKTLARLLAAATALVAPASAETLSSQAGPINVEVLAEVENPWGMTYLPDGRLLISEKQGELRVFADGKLGDAIGGLPAVVFKGQGGLLDVEIDPKFAENQLVYIHYVEAADPQPADAEEPGDTRSGTKPGADTVLKGGAVARGRLDGDTLKELTTIWRQEPKEIGRGHFGGRLAFSADGKLFISSGERQRFDPAQDPKGNLGKIVRINPDGSTPADNPFVKDGRADTYSMGHRNPLGLAIHPVTGALWENEMGPKGGDEINIIQPGKNYGWPIVSDGDNYDDTPIPDHKTRPEFQAPIISWNPAISPSGMAFYTADLFPSWKGSVLLGGLSSKALIRVMLDGDKVTGEERITTGQRIRDVIQAPDGAILVLTEGAAQGEAEQGQLWRLTPAK